VAVAEVALNVVSSASPGATVDAAPAATVTWASKAD